MTDRKYRITEIPAGWFELERWHGWIRGKWVSLGTYPTKSAAVVAMRIHIGITSEAVTPVHYYDKDGAPL